MMVTVESTGTLERRMRVQLPAERIENEIESRLAKVGKSVKIKGFRPGKVPKKVVRQRYGGQIRQEVLSDLMQKSYSDAVQQENLNPAAGPKIEPEKADNERDFAYVATFEVLPEVKLEKLDQIEVVRPEVEITDQDRRAYDQQPLVIAAKASIKTGPWSEQIRFHRALAYNAQSPKDYMLLSDLAQRVGARDLGVIKGISALSTDVGPIDETSFPTMSVPTGQESNWTIIHAITRQESQFAQAAISHAGARGLMQLMPGTAREQSGKIGLSYDASALTSDPLYNVRLGSSYFQRMLNNYGGSYPLAVAAYNAGPGNVNKWLRSNGDPRLGGIDWLKWIEEIPFTETRNYVKRVLENAVVYDTLNPRGPRFQGDATLTRYIGKNYKG